MRTTAILRSSLAAIAVCGLLFFAACKKNNDTVNPADDSISDAEQQATAEENSASESFSNDIMNISDAAASSGNSAFRLSSGEGVLFSPCATVTKDKVNHKITIDFGSQWCLCTNYDGRYRKGKIEIQCDSLSYFTTGFSKKITYTGYSVSRYNDSTLYHTLTGTHNVTNNGLNSSNQMYWTINASMTVTKWNGKSHTWTSNRTRTLISDNGTPMPWDNTWEINGNASGSNSNGRSYTITTTVPLVRELPCKWFQKGILEFVITNPKGKTKNVTLDYGYGNTAGTCDAAAEITINGTTKKVITLP